MKTSKIYNSNCCGQFYLLGKTKIINGVEKEKVKFVKTGYETYARFNDLSKGKVRDLIYPIYYLTNKITESNNYGPFIVLPKVKFNEIKKRNEYLVRFIETGYEVYSAKKEIETKKIKDPYKKTIFNIACLGGAKKQDNTQLYAIWFAILNRCYNKNNPQYKWYGEKNITVSKEWHTFENFLNDVQELEGWNKHKLNRKELNLDKDKKQIGVEKKVYSKNTCCWISPQENQKFREGRFTK